MSASSLKQTSASFTVTNSTTGPTIPTVSSRAAAFTQPPFSYVLDQFKAFENLYDPVKNTTGIITLGIAENKLMHHELVDRIKQFTISGASVLSYTASHGSPNLKAALSQFLPEYIFQINCKVEPSQLIVMAGCTAILYALSFILFEPDESVLTPTPYYPGFDYAFNNLGHVAIIGINSIDGTVVSSVGLDIASLEEAYQRSLLQRKFPKALLLANPSNPMGTIYSKDHLLTAVGWCRSKQIHLICDEVYALSVFDESKGEFVSVVSALGNDLRDDVHVIWGLSKDFGASGFRLGALYTHNKQLIQAMGRLADAQQSSHLTQDCAASVLNDKKFLTTYIPENKRRLAISYNIVKTNLESAGIHLIPAGAAIFVFADFRSCLSAPTWDAEVELRARMLQEALVVFSPGSACHAPVCALFLASVTTPSVAFLTSCHNPCNSDVLAFVVFLGARLFPYLLRMGYTRRITDCDDAHHCARTEDSSRDTILYYNRK